MINLDDLTLGQIKELQKMTVGFLSNSTPIAATISNEDVAQDEINQHAIGKYCIIRTYSAGVWAGVVSKKFKDELILTEARRLYKWHCVEGISLSEISLYGLVEEKSRINPPVAAVHLNWIEIIPATKESESSIRGAKNVMA